MAMIDQGGSGASANRLPGCLDENDAVDFVQGRLEPSRAIEIERHVDDCAPCRWLLSAVARATSASEIASEPRSGSVTCDGSAHAGATRLLRPGQQVGRYVIGGLRGVGSMGIVYAAHDTELARAVALKLLRDAAGAAVDVGRARLVREAQALARLSHPNVVAIHDIGVYGDEVFVAMELVEGAALDEWLHAAPRTPAEILEVMGGAGRGLAAAHAAGLIHRDVKPENILVGSDGRARMTDFGLVRVAASDESSPNATGDDPAAAGAAAGLTRTGALLGTPAYMSPEQLCRLPVGPASDQFSFAVTLYEALYGERPFRGDDLPSLRSRVLAGVVEMPRGRGAVPARVRRALRRALSVDPRRRYRSMEALLAELGSHDRSARRRVGIMAGASAAAVAAAAAVWIGAGGASSGGEPPCAGAARKLDGVWDPARRGLVKRAFVASGEAHALDAFARVARGLDDYTGAWVAMHGDTCAATAVRGEQSAEVLTLRMACLGKDLDLTRQLVDLFAARGFTGTAQAVIAVDGLPRLAECADIAALKAVAPLPADPARRARLAALDARMAELQARWLLDDFAAVRQAAPGLVGEASSIGYAPTTAAALLLAGDVESVSGAARAAEDKLYQALWAAEAAGDAEQVAQAWIRITRVVGIEQQRYLEGDRLLGNAEQAVEREAAISPSAGTALRVAFLSVAGAFAYATGDDEVALARASEALALEEQHFGRDTARAATLHDNLTKYKMAVGDPAGGMVENQRALAIAERRFGAGPYLVKFHSSGAFVLQAQGKYAEAAAAFEQALAIAAQVFKTDPPQVGVMLGALAIVRQSMNDYDRADPLLQRALEIFIRTRGAESGEVGVTLERLGVSAQHRGQLADAQAYFERSLAISERIQKPDHVEVAQRLSSLGDVLIARGQQARAVPLLERAVHIMEARWAAGDRGYPFVLARFRFQLAQALWAQPHERPRARAVLQAARDVLDPASTDRRVTGQLAEIVQWSAAHRR